GILVGLAMTMTGFVTYRYRETRAMTLAQFFEMRYSRSFRVFAGLLSFLSGILNYALFPAIGGRFFLYYCGFPDSFHLFGLEWSTFGTLMALFLGVALVIVMTGGQLTTMITDCLQGIYSYFAYALLVGVIFYTFSFAQFKEVMFARPEGYSFINPFDTGMMTDFNIFYVLIG
ncbi:sodium:proline symporter, partial [Victivallis vadensis]